MEDIPTNGMYMAISNVNVDLILWLFLYVTVRTIYVVSKFYSQWLYYRNGFLNYQSIQYNTWSPSNWTYLSIMYICHKPIVMTEQCPSSKEKKEKKNVPEAGYTSFLLQVLKLALTNRTTRVGYSFSPFHLKLIHQWYDMLKLNSYTQLHTSLTKSSNGNDWQVDGPIHHVKASGFQLTSSGFQKDRY